MTVVGMMICAGFNYAIRNAVPPLNFKFPGAFCVYLQRSWKNRKV